MNFRRKLILLVVAIVVVLLTPYFIWHDEMDAYFASEGYQRWLLSVKPFAWMIGIALIVGDLVLPVPTPPVMATLGTLYGTVLGGLIASTGSVLAGLTAYGLARAFGDRGARMIASEEELVEFRRFFDNWGAAGIIASRALPILPEVLTLLAGLAGMHLGRFVLSLVLGSVPVGLLMAFAGDWAGESSTLLLVLTLIPAALWIATLLVLGRRSRAEVEAEMAPAEAVAAEPEDLGG
ncbi:TVP38/TMEM64 family protein [Tautonia plasticadhaerens]|uniref:TVP38/TMEM64 family inner membrane protein YdjZ n=1 Tax=Tautonia plasticadhaerens TaxID=2527974 RepID=A0A518HD84_9BACT|nr:VTT domain-containing protein [Tautonia plasticadhaerens]QDV38825.1 TVP38/TMEM64 family inner membrane protein YdjZ [Tautonia plasticadhaerens]